jgi:hypothetical protein
VPFVLFNKLPLVIKKIKIKKLLPPPPFPTKKEKKEADLLALP